METTDNRYSIYRDGVVTLAKTIVIKSSEAAAAINQNLVEQYGADAVSDDPTTWKYYLNLAGEYHPTDQVMTVVSMDTQETIVFSKDNLAIHRATTRGYAYGSQSYNELLANYPNQEKLIRGILYPVDLTTAINAKNFTILGYPPDLIEENEYNFVAKLQDWINGLMARWFVRGFTVTDSLYTATVLMILYVYLVPAIMEIRLAACKTNEAHSFHVKKYLASHGLNEDYLDYLTLSQSLWLYRNIEYLQHNLGSQANLNLLMANLMTNRQLPLAQYTMRHNTSNMPTDIYPTVQFQKKTLNFPNADLVPVVLTLEQILDKQDQFARSNQDVREQTITAIQEVMENSPSNVLLTKFMESTVTDYGDDTPYPLLDVLMGHWPYLASLGLYTAFVAITNPLTNEEFTLSANDAFILTCYAFAMGYGFTPVMVPAPLAERVQRIPMPSTADLLSVVDPSVVSLADAQDMLSQQPVITPIISIDDFYSTCEEIYHSEQHQRGLAANGSYSVRRAMLQNMATRIYCDASCTMVPTPTYYSTWLAQNNLDFSNFAAADYQTMCNAIIQTATGLSLQKTVSIAQIQKAMVGIFTSLSSYSIQINAEVNGNDLIVLETPQVRFGIDDVTTFDLKYLQDEICVVKCAKTTTMTEIEFDMNPPSNREVLTIRDHMGDVHFETGVNMQMADNGRSTHMAFNVPIGFKFAQTYPDNSRGIIPVPGVAEWLTLTPDQQMQVIDMYDTGLPPVIPTSDYADPTDIDNVLQQKVLSGLVYNPDQQHPDQST